MLSLANPRVHIKLVHPRREVHFKIIDDAAKGYVSAHPQGATDRQYRSYDCTRTSSVSGRLL